MTTVMVQELREMCKTELANVADLEGYGVAFKRDKRMAVICNELLSRLAKPGVEVRTPGTIEVCNLCNTRSFGTGRCEYSVYAHYRFPAGCPAAPPAQKAEPQNLQADPAHHVSNPGSVRSGECGTGVGRLLEPVGSLPPVGCSPPQKAEPITHLHDRARQQLQVILTASENAIHPNNTARTVSFQAIARAVGKLDEMLRGLKPSPPTDSSGRDGVIEECAEAGERASVRIEHGNGSDKGPKFHWCTACQSGRWEDETEEDRPLHTPDCPIVAIRALKSSPAATGLDAEGERG